MFVSQRKEGGTGEERGMEEAGMKGVEMKGGRRKGGCGGRDCQKRGRDQGETRRGRMKKKREETGLR